MIPTPKIFLGLSELAMGVCVAMLRLSFEGKCCRAEIFSVFGSCRVCVNFTCTEKKQLAFKPGRRRRGARMAVEGCKLSEA
jgi:hypothetical protein